MSGRRKALIIGINYNGSSHQLSGCINDAINVRDFLVNDRGFSSDSNDMVVMTDAPENYGTPFWPNGANLLAAFGWLTSWNQAGDSIWLSYSGHGGKRAVEGAGWHWPESTWLTQRRPGCRRRRRAIFGLRRHHLSGRLRGERPDHQRRGKVSLGFFSNHG